MDLFSGNCPISKDKLQHKKRRLQLQGYLNIYSTSKNFLTPLTLCLTILTIEIQDQGLISDNPIYISSSIWHQYGCQKIRKTKLKTTLVSWRAKIQPKLNKIQKTFRKQGFFDNFCSILMVFHSFFNFG